MKRTPSALSNQVRVWDPLVRIFHWSLVLFFAVAWLSEDNVETLHVYAGYTIASLVVFRLVWGVIGPPYARFTNFVTGPRASSRYLGQMARGDAPRHVGHNPAAAAMIVSLLTALAMTTVSGMILFSTDGGGPLAGTFFASFPEHSMEEVHEFFANATLLLIFIHVGGVLVSSVMHRENLIAAMFHGKKRPADADANATPEPVSEGAKS